jgi:hypothetical protein
MKTLVVGLLMFCFWATTGITAESVTLTSDGWTLIAEKEKGTLRIAQEKLGTLLNEVKVNLQSSKGSQWLKEWTVKTESSNKLTFVSLNPPCSWSFETFPTYLKILSTSPQLSLTARAPAGKERLVARLMDSEGVPVVWRVTDEAKGRWGTPEFPQTSYLPAHQANTMHFSMGTVSGNQFHALFDRPTDIAIQFPDQSRMQGSSSHPDFLEVAIPVQGASLIRLIKDYYTKTLGVPYYVPYDDSRFSHAPAVWCSWTAYYHEAREEDIVKNTDWLAANLKPYGFQYVQVDDGYDRGPKGEHFWIENWDPKIFPHGPKWIADYIKSKGLHPGLWLVPNVYAGATKQHPDWYLYDKKGKFIWDYSTPSLDSTHPEVQVFLRKLFTTLKEWGYEYYKFDGENALPRYVPNLDLDRLHDKNIDPLVAYRERLKLIRETVGPDTFIEGCPAGMPLNGIGFFNSYFTGDDVYNSWQGMYPFFSSISANAFLNHLVVYVMPAEGIDVGPQMTVEEASRKRVPEVVNTARGREKPLMGFSVTLPEARTLTTYASLTGVVYSLASVMPELPEERSRLLKMTLPPQPIMPMDLFSRGTDMRWDRFKHTTPDQYIHHYPEILDLKVNSVAGVYDVVGMTNWRSTPDTRTLSFSEDLGLEKGWYVVFDFWNQKILGVYQEKLDVAIEPHDTRVLALHPLLQHPQLVGNSRHISGTYSVSQVDWEAAKNLLQGVVESVPGDPYVLTLYVPNGMKVANVRAWRKAGQAVEVSQQQTGTSCVVEFAGQPEPVNWAVEFSGANAAGLAETH